MNYLNRMWNFNQSFHNTINEDLKNYEIEKQAIESENNKDKEVIKETVSEFKEYYDSMIDDEKADVKKIVPKVIKLVGSKISKLKNIDDESIANLGLSYVMSFSVNLLEEVNSHKLGKEFADFGTEFFMTQLNIPKINFYSNIYSDFSKLASETNHAISYDLTTAYFIIYDIFNLLKIKDELVRPFINKFVELCDKEIRTWNEDENPFEESVRSSVQEDIVTGDTTKVATGNMNDVMYLAVKNWESNGKAKNIERLKKGQLSKEFPQFKLLELFDNYESIVFDVTGSETTGTKMILATNGQRYYNFTIQLNTNKEWTAQEFHKMFMAKSESKKEAISNPTSVNEDANSVATEIRRQLYAGGINSAGAYFGANQLVAGKDDPMTKDKIKELTGEYAKDIFASKGNDGFLMFKASGSKLKRGGKVKIALNGKDLYDVSVYRIGNGEHKIIKQLPDVYAEDIFDVLKDILG